MLRAHRRPVGGNLRPPDPTFPSSLSLKARLTIRKYLSAEPKLHNSSLPPERTCSQRTSEPPPHHDKNSNPQSKDYELCSTSAPRHHSTTVGIDCKAHHTSSTSPETQPNADTCTSATTPPTTRSAILYYTPRNSHSSPAFSERKRNVA